MLFDTDQLWVADITYVAIPAGFVFVAVILDAWSRKAGVMPLEFWLGRFADAETQQVYRARQQALYGLAEASSPPVRGDLFLPGLKKARKIWLTQGEKASGRREPTLLPLNPTMP